MSFGGGGAAKINDGFNSPLGFADCACTPIELRNVKLTARKI
jgi:hypothetical protein